MIFIPAGMLFCQYRKAFPVGTASPRMRRSMKKTPGGCPAGRRLASFGLFKRRKKPVLSLAAIRNAAGSSVREAGGVGLLSAQQGRSLPKKQMATVPGPQWAPITGPT